MDSETKKQILVAPRPAVPWSVPLLAVYMWFFWQYLQGRWWPRSTNQARRRYLRARQDPEEPAEIKPQSADGFPSSGLTDEGRGSRLLSRHLPGRTQ